MKKRLAYLLLTFLMLLPAFAAAATPDVRISYESSQETDDISWYRIDNANYYLFLPGEYDLSRAVFSLRNVSSLIHRESGQTIASGDSAAFLTPGDHVFTLNGHKTTLHVMQGSPDLPVLYITTESGSLTKIHKDKDNKEAGELIFVGSDGAIQYQGALEHIKCRGNSSMTFAKKNYQIKLETGTDLMGMGKAKRWILTGNYRDKSLLRNQFLYDMADTIGLPYTPEHTSAEVYINNEYQGVYLFSEKIEIDGDRVDIANLEKATEDLNPMAPEDSPLVGSRTSKEGKYKAYDITRDPEDITGGYLVEYESYPVRYKEDPSAYTTSHGSILVVQSPEYASEAQMEYVSGKLQAFENAIFAKDGVDARSGLHYAEIVDLPSLVRKYLMEEFSKNYDGNSSSMYFFKPQDSVSTLFYAGPVWDYDSTFGSYAREDNKKNVLSSQGLWIASSSEKKHWWPALYKQADFKAAVVAEWNARMKPAVEILLGLREAPEDGSLRSLQDYAAAIEASAAMNLVRWPRPANPSAVANTGVSLRENIAQLTTFIQGRYDFLCQEWATP